ncbi:MAG: hypothetical protein ACRCVV_02665 [Shewanella sp.]
MAPVKTLSILNLALSIGGTLASGKYLLQLAVIDFSYVIGRLGEDGLIHDLGKRRGRGAGGVLALLGCNYE